MASTMMNVMTSAIPYVLCLVAWIGTEPGPQVGRPGPTAAVTEAQRALDAAAVVFTRQPFAREEVASARQAFFAALTRISSGFASAGSPRQARRELQAPTTTVVALAAELARSPQAYARIEGRYGKALTGGRADVNPPLDPQDCTEATRFAWEVLLLAPPAAGAWPGYERTAVRALGMIGNPASVSALAAAYSLTTRPDVRFTAFVKERQQLLLEWMLHFRTREALQAVLSSTEQSEAQMGRLRPGDEEAWDPARFVADLLKRNPEEGIRQDWRELAKGQPRQKLSAGQRRLLDALSGPV